MAVRSSGGANTTAPELDAPAKLTTTAKYTTTAGASGSKAERTTRIAAAAQRHADVRTAPASIVDATRVVANAVPTPTVTKLTVSAATIRQTTAARHVAPEVSESPLPAQAKTTTPTIPTPIDTVPGMISAPSIRS